MNTQANNPQPTESMFTASFDAMLPPPSDVPAWSVVAALLTIALTWAVATFVIDSRVAEAPPPTQASGPVFVVTPL